MSDDIPCKDCGAYYSHKRNCTYWLRTRVSDSLVVAEIKQRVDADLYKSEVKISQLEKENAEKDKLIAELKEELAKERECVDYYGVTKNWQSMEMSDDGIEDDYEKLIKGRVLTGGKRARQRIKERKRF